MNNDSKTTKHIANLDFDISKGEEQLKKLATLVNTLSTNTEKEFKNMAKTIESSTKFDKINDIDLSKFTKNFNKLTEKMVVDNNKAQNRILINHENNVEKRLTIEKNYQEKTAYENQKTANKLLVQEQRLQNQLNATVENGFSNRLGKYMETFTTYTAFNTIKNAARETIEEMKNVEYRMMEISRIMEDGSIVVNDYRDSLIDLASQYGRTFDEVSSVTLNFARAGYSADEALKMTESSLLALNTAELDASQATDGLISVMAQWGMDTGTAAEKNEKLAATIDKINKVADNFPITSEGLLEALQRTSQGFNLAGATIDETIAMIVAAEREAQRGGRVIGTAMANMVQQLKAEKKLDLAEQLGLNFYTDETKQQFKSITDIFAEMSQRMQALKDNGKESSVEMQQLLELFTVFRRNIGAGLLSEMSGEDSTYLDALNTSLNSVGYSLQENSKYMETAAAKQNQLNAEMLKLKTEVWDGGLEDVYKGFLEIGRDVIKGLTDLIDKFGTVPVAIGFVTAGFTALNKNMKIDIKDFGNVTNAIKAFNTQTDSARTGLKKFNDETASNSLKKYLSTVKSGEATLGGYAKSLVVATLKEAAMTIATIALNAALTAGLAAIATFITTGLDNLIHAHEKAIEKINEEIDKNKEAIDTYKTQANTLSDLAKKYQDTYKEYNELKESKADTGEAESKLLTLQGEINTALKDTGTQVDIITYNTNEHGESVAKVNDKYDEQLSKIKAIAYETKKQQAEETKAALENEQKLFNETYKNQIKEYGTIQNYIKEMIANYEMYNEISTSGLTEEQKEIRQEQLDFFEKTINQVLQDYSKVTNAASDYKSILAELYSGGIIQSVQDYDSFLSSISQSYENLEGPQKLIDGLHNINSEFINGKIEAEEYFSKIQNSIKDINLKSLGEDFKLFGENANGTMQQTVEGIKQNKEEIEAYQAIFAATTESVAQGIEILQSQLENGQIIFSEYANGMTDAGQTSLDLYTKANGLIQDQNGLWRDAKGNVNEYANSLQDAVKDLDSFDGIINSITENQAFLNENLNEMGELALTNVDLSSQAYQNFANSFIDGLNAMKEANKDAFKEIVEAAANASGRSADEFKDANGNITNALAADASAMQAAVNTSTAGIGQALGNLTTSAGKVITSLAQVISHFDYTLDFTPSGNLNFNLENFLNGGDAFTGSNLSLKIKGHGGHGVDQLGFSLAQFGKNLANMSPVVMNLGDILSKSVRRTGGGGGGTTTPYTPYTPVDTGGTGSGGSSYSSTEKNTILQDFKDAISEREKEEQRWVKKQKELNQLSLNDQKYILQEEIKRYKTYADEVMKLTGVTEEEKLKVRKEYLQKAEDLELDYISTLENELKEQINAIKNKYDERVDKINEVADAEIAAIRKVENENDRVREKEEYLQRRDEIIHGHEGIEYWEQRTGRAAQLALAEARKNLADLDREWQDKQETWNADDQIAAIEARKDADVEAAYAARDAEIAALQEAFDYRVKVFAETGKLIYDDATIQSKALYDTYKKNFIDPVGSELRNALSQQAKSTSSNSSSGGTQDYIIQWGDTLTSIANKFGTTIAAIMSANPYITNPNLIYAGASLKIPKSHTGSKILQDGLVNLQAGEIVLNTKWARDMDRMLNAYANSTKNGGTVNNGNTVNVKGDMMKIEATIEDKSDINTLTRKIKKTLEKQFSIN